MSRPSRTIWDTRIQCVCGVIAARDPNATEVFLCANFGQVSLSPPRIIINPNRVYPIEELVRRIGRFSLSVLTPGHRSAIARLIALRRREPDKAGRAGLRLELNPQGIPFVRDASEILFCEVEQVLATGDHTVVIARVTERKLVPSVARQLPLLYREISGSQGTRPWRLRARNLAVATGIPEILRRLKQRVRPPAPADLPGDTYRHGGFTDAELARILRYDTVDRGRMLSPPPPRSVVRKPLGICIVGTHWGLTHCRTLRSANPAARLFLCGRDPERTARLAARVHAEAHFVGLEAAVRDPRVQAVILALPHHLHCEAAELALTYGKHVLVEKPIATTLEQADRMIAAAARAGRILMVAENMHFRPSLRLVSDRLTAGDAGEPLHLLVRTGAVRRPESWMADREKLGGGAFMDIGIHYVRALRLLLGEPDEVTAFRPMQINTRMTGEDALEVMFTSRVGWQSHFLATWSAGLGILPDIVLAGDRGTFHLWPLAGYYDFYPVAPRPLVRLLGYVRPYALQSRLLRPGLQRKRVRFGGPDSGYEEEMREFLSAVAEDRPPVTSGADARRDLEIVLRCYEAMDTGQRVEIPPWPS